MTTTPRERFLAYRRVHARPGRLTRETVRARGLDFAVYRTAPVHGQRPVLCINGGLIFGHQLLWPALAPLAEQRQLIFYDQRGRGATPAPPGVRAARIEHDALDVPALREALGIDAWDVLGHSWGGGIALLAAAADRAATRSLTLLNAVGPHSEWLPGLHARGVDRLPEPERSALLATDVAKLAEPDPEFHLLYHRVFYPAWFADLSLARMLAPPHSISLTGATIAARLRRDGYDWQDTLRGLDMPALVLHGTADLIPLAMADATAALLPRATRVNIDDAGHLPFFEAPDATFGAVVAHLAAVAP
jgi:proline iminopeptidase